MKLNTLALALVSTLGFSSLLMSPSANAASPAAPVCSTSHPALQSFTVLGDRDDDGDDDSDNDCPRRRPRCDND